jgi:medium-chain acyl-[acyl-carrier-protein] hydrolase
MTRPVSEPSASPAIPRPDHWIVRPAPRDRPRLRLFCLPCAGGTAASFRDWPRHLPPDVEVCAFELPGRSRRLLEPAYATVDELVEALAEQMAPLGSSPFALFGHSMGALIAFELAKARVRRGEEEPCQLFVAASRAPQYPSRDRPVHGLPDSELIEHLRAVGGTPEEILRNTEMVALLLPAVRADFALCERYRLVPGPGLSCPIDALGGSGDPLVSRRELLGWQAQTTGEFRLRMYEGGHFFTQSAPDDVLHGVAKRLSRSIARDPVSRRENHITGA